MLWAGLIILGYLSGSIPFGLLVGRLKGVDIRTQGSGNIGATNAGRVLGRSFGYAVFTLDVLKGLLPTLLAGAVVRRTLIDAPPSAVLYALWVGVAAAAVLGHMFPVWLRFKGGKGVATSVGALLGVYPYFTIPALVVLGIWCVLTLTTRYVSVGSVGAALLFPVVFAIFSSMHRDSWGGAGDLWPLHVMCMIIAALIVIRHRANIRRLMAGTESRIGRGAR